MDADKFPNLWLNRLGFKIFSCNQRENILPNLWCLCTSNLNPTVLDIDNQQVSFSIKFENQLFFISVVYASTINLKRKELWSKLTNLQNQHNASWCFVDDFNTVLGAHEHKGHYPPARPP